MYIQNFGSYIHIEHDSYTCAIVKPDPSVGIPKHSIKDFPQYEISHPKQKFNSEAARLALSKLLPINQIHVLKKHIYGFSYLADSNLEISLTHQNGVGAAIVSSQNSGIDYQTISNKCLLLASKFIDQADAVLPLDLNSTTLIWTVKETVFKWWKVGKVDFKNDIRILNINNDFVEVLFKNNYCLNIYYINVFNGYLSWTSHPK